MKDYPRYLNLKRVSQGMAFVYHMTVFFLGPPIYWRKCKRLFWFTDQKIQKEKLTVQLNELFLDKNLRESWELKTTGSLLDKFSMENVAKNGTTISRAFSLKNKLFNSNCLEIYGQQ